MSAPNPMTLLTGKTPSDLPKVEQLGIITLEELQKYHCDNADRRLLSLFGRVYDVTSSEASYGADGAYKEYAGHDVTLALSKHKTDDIWLDRFVKMEEKWTESAKGWQNYFDAKYPLAGKLDRWENEDPDNWAELSPEELESLETGCILM